MSEISWMKLQRLQNFAAKVVLKKKKGESSTQCLHELHWLPCKTRTDFKILCLVYKCINDIAPGYLKSLISLHPKSARNMRSNDTFQLLNVPYVQQKTFFERGFSLRGPRLWNELPDMVKKAKSLDEFKKLLKTFLYDCVYL